MRSVLWAGLAGLSCLALVSPAHGFAVRRPVNVPVQQRVAQAEAVVVGKVTGIDDKTAKAERFPGDKAEYRVATVKVQEGLLGTRGLTHVKVAFLVPTGPMPGGPGGGPVGPGGPGRRPPIGRPFFQPPTLAAGQEVLLFLQPHPKETFYVLQNDFDVVDRKAGTFAADLAQARKSAKLIADPTAGLKAKSAEERFQTAALLIARYRTQKPGFTKTEPVGAEESKLILQALAGADWDQAPRPGAFNPLTPQNLFYMLGASPQDGWTPPQGDFRQVPAAMKSWLKENAGKYRVQRWVAGGEQK